MDDQETVQETNRLWSILLTMRGILDNDYNKYQELKEKFVSLINQQGMGELFDTVMTQLQEESDLRKRIEELEEKNEDKFNEALDELADSIEYRQDLRF